LCNLQIKRPWLGVELVDVTPELADSLDLARPEGTLVKKLHPASPLLAAGIQTGDVILAIDGKAVESSQEFGFRVGTAAIGGTRIIDYRRGSQNLVARIKLIAAPETVPRDEATIYGDTPFAGLKIANLSPAVSEQIGLPAEATGVAITNATGARGGFFQQGDIIAFVNGVAVDSVATLRKILQQPQSRWQIGIDRKGQKLRLRLG
jgi:S1-C subfamily serine protease